MDTTDRAVIAIMVLAMMIGIASVHDKVETQCGPANPPVKIRVAV